MEEKKWPVIRFVLIKSYGFISCIEVKRKKCNVVAETFLFIPYIHIFVTFFVLCVTLGPICCAAV